MEEEIIKLRIFNRTAGVFCGSSDYGKTRQVSFPVSKKILEDLGVDKNEKIILNG